MNNSPSNTFWLLIVFERFQQNCPTVLAATGMNGLKKIESNRWQDIKIMKTNFIWHRIEINIKVPRKVLFKCLNSTIILISICKLVIKYQLIYKVNKFWMQLSSMLFNVPVVPLAITNADECMYIFIDCIHNTK